MSKFGALMNAGYAGQESAKTLAADRQYIPPSYLDQLKQQRDNFQERLNNLNALITKLESNQEFVDLIDLMNKV